MAYVYFALARIGAVMIAVNTRYRPEEIEYVPNKSRASLLICKDEPNKNYLALLQDLAPGVGRIEIALPPAKLPFLKQVVVASERQLVGCMTLAEVAKRGESIADSELANAARKVSSEDIAMIQFTSGTTAVPKGALLFQIAMLRSAQCGCRALQLTELDRFFSPQPFFHVGGSIQVMLTPIVSGCTMIVQPYFDAGEALALMERHQCSVLMGHQPQPDGKEFLPQGQSGEVCFKGWCITKGYFDDPEKTAEAIDGDGWFRTGDLGIIGSDGYLRLIGRIKDIIRVSGENVAAAEVEHVLILACVAKLFSSKQIVFGTDCSFGLG